MAEALQHYNTAVAAIAALYRLAKLAPAADPVGHLTRSLVAADPKRARDVAARNAQRAAERPIIAELFRQLAEAGQRGDGAEMQAILHRAFGEHETKPYVGAFLMAVNQRQVAADDPVVTVPDET